MSEADTPNNQPLPEPPASANMAAEVSKDWTIADAVQIVKLSELSELRDVDQQSIEEQPNELYSETTELSTNLEPEDSNTDSSNAVARERTNDADWFALAQKMRQRNRRLLEQVNQLRVALQEKEEALHDQHLRSRERETFLVQQADEMNTLQEQLGRLFHALEASHQASVRQQILIETLSEQLQSSQERVAQLERECALTQQRYNEQSHQIVQTTNTCKELAMRLNRQQRQTLQFKTALEKCLEMPHSHSVAQQQLPQITALPGQTLSHKAQPIQPWSAEPELAEDNFDFDHSLWEDSAGFEPTREAYSSQAEAYDTRRSQDTDLLATTETHILSFASSQEIAATELELEKQLLAEMTTLAEAAGLSESKSELAEPKAQFLLEPGKNQEASEAFAPYLSYAQDTNNQDTDPGLEIEELWGDTTNPESVEPNEASLPLSNWPSPVLYPLRPPKKRKSLAAIELPSFPRFHQ